MDNFTTTFLFWVPMGIQNSILWDPLGKCFYWAKMLDSVLESAKIVLYIKLKLVFYPK